MSKRESTVVATVMLADQVMGVFEGLASDLAYYELLEMAEQYLNADLTREAWVEHLEFTMGIDNKTLGKALRKYNKQWLEYQRVNNL